MAALAMNFMSLEKVLILKCLFLPKASLLAVWVREVLAVRTSGSLGNQANIKGSSDLYGVEFPNTKFQNYKIPSY
jgi:diphosphomevalonate decarboxylase